MSRGDGTNRSMRRSGGVNDTNRSAARRRASSAGDGGGSSGGAKGRPGHRRVGSHEVGAYASLLAVDVASPRQHNALESFFIAETLKYLFLLFSDADALPYDLSGLVLTTEAHFVPAAPLRPGAADDADGSDEDDVPEAGRWPRWWRD